MSEQAHPSPSGASAASQAPPRSALRELPAERRFVLPAVGVVVALAAVLVLVVIGALWELREDAVAAQHRALATLSMALADELDRGLQGVVVALESTRDGLRAQAPALPGPTSQMLRERALLLPLVADFWTLDRSGRVTAASTSAPPPPLDSFYPRPSVVPPPAPRAVSISRPFAVDSREEVALLTALTDESGQVVGWLLAGVPTNEWEGAFAVARPASDARQLVLRSDGVPLAGSSLADVPGRGQRTLVEKVAGVDGFVEVQSLRHFPVRVLVMRDASASLVRWRSLARVVGAGLVITLVVFATLLAGLLRAERGRQRTERAWRAEQARIALAAAAAQEGYWEWAPRRGELFLSRRMLALFELRADEAAGGLRALIERVHPEDRAALSEALDPGSLLRLGDATATGRPAIDLAVRVRTGDAPDLLRPRTNEPHPDPASSRTSDLAGDPGSVPASGYGRGAASSRTNEPRSDPGSARAGDSGEDAGLLRADGAARGAEVPPDHDSRWRWVRWRGNAASSADGHVERVAGVAFDITAEREQLAQQERLEAQLVQSRKLEALGTLAGGVAHDFNNVLAALLGYAELAQQSAPQGSLLARQLERVVQAGLRGKAVVARILSFSRGASPRSDSVFAVQPLARQVIDLLAPTMPAGVHVELAFDDTPLYTRGDATLCFEAVMNLCTNALQAMPEGGLLTLAVTHAQAPEGGRLVSHGVLPAGEFAEVRVQDSGTGIAPEIMERLFEPFFTTRGQRGTGLGLSVVRGVVDEAGGAVDVRSVPGQGSCFSLYFPLHAAPDDVDTLPFDVPLGEGQCVLVLDDDPALVALAEETLARLGYEPVGFDDPMQALDAVGAEPARFDAVLSDEIMPGLDGTGFARRVHELRPDLPVLIVSGFGGPGLAERAAQAGVRQVLAKPLAQADLARALALLFASPPSAAPGREPQAAPEGFAR